MADQVKQHYVPQFYFRNFARDERICTYNLDNEEGYQPTPISNICYERYFYGDGETEKVLSKLESKMAKTIHQITDQYSLEPVKTDEQARLYLDLFVTYTHSRTKAAREESSALSQEILEMITEVGVEAGEIEEDTLEMVRNDQLRLEGPDHQLYQLLSLHGPIYFADLHRVLIWNGSDRNFITSDHPVVLDNSRFKDVVELNPTGYSSAGLQVFCPLSNDLLLLYFDPNAYQVDANSEYTVIVRSEEVIEELNKLQLLNCLENCYYRDESDSSWVDSLYQDVKNNRPEELITREKSTEYDKKQGKERELIRTHSPKIQFTPKLPFITEIPTSQFTPVRNPELRDTAEEMYENAIQEAREDAESE